ncbi:MAG TPA: TonB family protein [Rhodopila sp.]|nr:TonB family protein [Rhodopila sp.]
MISLRPSVLSSGTPSALRSKRSIWIGLAVLVSVALHAGAIVLLTVAHRGPAPAPPVQGAVELLMVEKQGAEASQAAPPPTPPPQAEAKAKAEPKAEPKPETPTPPPPPSPPAPVAKDGEVPAPTPVPPEPAKPEPAKPEPPKPPAPQQAETAEKAQPAPPVKPAPPSPQKALVFDFNGTDSPSNARATGSDILPASPDDRFRNRPPPYPMEAARRGEHGGVTLMIHVGADGLTSGVDVIESSGFASLDQAAIAAVWAWHFHPALRDSQPVPFDMPFRFEYQDK